MMFCCCAPGLVPCQECGSCIGPTPPPNASNRYLIEISGITNNGIPGLPCINCGVLNGAFLVDGGGVGGNCGYTAATSLNACLLPLFDLVTVTLDIAPDPFSDPAIEIQLEYNNDLFQQGSVTFRKSWPAGVPCMTLDQELIPFLTDTTPLLGGNCDTSNAEARISTVACV